MNLIEQQTAAKELPMQYLQQAVNGQNPNLTPWIATAELQRRTTMNQHMQNAQAPQGPQPTVKDQVEQKAGLMATQAAQQAQAAQAQQSSTPPGPVPAGVPQPEPQPEEPVMAARGGLMDAPVSFDFAHGGILGYAGDGPQGSRVRSRLPNESFEQYRQRIIALEAEDAARADADAQAQQESERQQLLASRQASGQALPRSPFSGAPAAPAAPMGGSGRGGQGGASAAEMAAQGIKAALPQPAPAPTQRPPAPPAPKPQVPPPPPQASQGQVQPDTMGPAGKAAMDFATAPTKERTLEDIIAENRAIQKEAGTDQPMGVDEGAQRARQDDVQKRQQEQAKKLAWAAAIRDSVGVPGSVAATYNQTMANALGKEAEYEGARYTDIAALAAAKRKAAETQQTALESPAAAGRLASAAAAKDKAYTAANIYGTQEQAKASKYSVDEHVKSAKAIAELQERAASARQGSSDAKQAARELRDRELAIEVDIKSLTSRANKLTGSISVEDRRDLASIKEELKNAYAQKALIRGGPAAAATPAPATRLKFDAQGKPIK